MRLLLSSKNPLPLLFSYVICRHSPPFPVRKIPLSYFPYPLSLCTPSRISYPANRRSLDSTKEPQQKLSMVPHFNCSNKIYIVLNLSANRLSCPLRCSERWPSKRKQIVWLWQKLLRLRVNWTLLTTWKKPPMSWKRIPLHYRYHYFYSITLSHHIHMHNQVVFPSILWFSCVSCKHYRLSRINAIIRSFCLCPWN